MRVRMRRKKGKRVADKRTKEQESKLEQTQKKQGKRSKEQAKNLEQTQKKAGKRSQNRESKRKLKIGNIAIVLCVVIAIIIVAYMCLKPAKKVTPSGITLVETNTQAEEEITEEKARKVAVKQFKNLKENVKQEDLNVLKIQRSGEEYYYITSAQNSLEIKIKGGQITRINSASVEE